jgi:flagellar hook-associated protein 2
VTLTAKEVTEQLVTVNVERDTQPAVTNVKAFVSQYNKMLDKLKDLTVFNAETNEVGLLFGSSEALRIETSYTRLLSGQVFGAGSMKSIRELGMGFSETGKLELDEAKLVDKLANNSADVTEFLTKADTGLLARLNNVAERIAGEGNSLLLTRNETLSIRIQRNTQQTESLNVRLNNERERLLRQYFAAEQAISKLQSNQSALSQIRFFGGSNSE